MSFKNLLLDNLTTSIILLNNKLHIKYINAAAEIMLSTSSQRCMNLPISDILSEKTDTLPLQQILERNQPCTKYDTYLLTHNNQEIMADYVITPISSKNQSFLLIEITPLDLLRVPQEIVTLSQQAGNNLLLRGLAHEIKNPLGGIRGAAQLLKRALPDESFKEYTNILIEEVDRLSNLVNRMLGSNKLPILQPTNIHEVLERVYQLIFTESQGNITLIKDYDPSIPEITADTEQIIQALLNITRNALQALIETATVNPQITFKTRILRQYTIGSIRHRLVINIDIIDNGPGIPSQIKDTLFFPMVSGRPEGTGLGLAIAQNIITHHKGVIECHSQTGNTKFSIFLPLE